MEDGGTATANAHRRELYQPESYVVLLPSPLSVLTERAIEDVPFIRAGQDAHR
jgi:hypothetical protein